MSQVEEGHITGCNEKEDPTSEWLKKNKLSHLVEKFKNVEIELDELIELTNENDDFLNSLIESNTITSTDKIRIKRAVKSMNKSNNNEKMKIVTVLMSDHEEAAMNKLNKQKQSVLSLMDQFKKYQNEINENTEKCRNEIDEKFKNIFVKLQQEKQKITNKLQAISQQKQAEVSKKSQTLNDAKSQYDAALNSCNQLIQNLNIDRFERKQKILSLCNNAMNQSLLKDNTINTQIIIQFNDNGVAPFLSSLCDVYGKESHPLPVINNVKIESIGTQTATMSWNAKLSQKNEDAKTDNKLYMKVDCINDELEQKEKETLSSDLILFQKSKQKYIYRWNGLNKASEYKMTLNLFETKSPQNDPKQSQQRNDFRSVTVSFKTLKGKTSKGNAFKWMAQVSPKRNYPCYYDVLKNGKTLIKSRDLGSIDILRMDPWLSKQKGNVFKLYVTVEDLNNIDWYYGFGVITKQRWNTDTAWYLGSTNGSYYWRFTGDIYLGNNKKSNMPPISKAGQTMGLEIDFVKNTIMFTLHNGSDINNVISSSIGTFDEMKNQEICVAIASRKKSQFTILDK